MYEQGIKGWMKHFDFIILDLLCLQTAFFLSYLIYNGGNPYGEPLYRNMAVGITLIDVFVIFFQETYKNVLKRGYYKEFISTVKQTVFIMLFTVLVLFVFQKSKEYSRMTLAIMMGIYAVFRYTVTILRKLYLVNKGRKFGKVSMLIVTDFKNAESVLKTVMENSYGRFAVTGLIISDRDMKGEKIMNIPVVENLKGAAEYIGEKWVDEVLIAHSGDTECLTELIENIKLFGVTFHQILTKHADVSGEKQFVQSMGGYKVLTTTVNSMTKKQAFAKRAFDIAGGLIGCLLAFVIGLVIAPFILISSPGPLFFVQKRVGRNGKVFKMYKFRSMYPNAEKRKAELMEKNKISDDRMFKLDFDPRVIGNRILPDGTKKTGIGQFIRNTSLDEFPQFFNVLIGNMSLVGTRPCLPEEWENYEPNQRIRAAVKPEITGMWQVSGRSDITDFNEVVRLDREYINNWSLGLDIKILLKTVRVVIKKEGSA